MEYKFLLGYLLIVNIITFITFGYDKYMAKTNRWRVSVNALFLLVCIGGGVGAIIGMKVWRHKTKKRCFKYGIPVIIFIQISSIFIFS